MNEPYYGDLDKTNNLIELFKTPKEKRDLSWRDGFLANVVDASFAKGNPEVILGPDGFPYFYLVTPEVNQSFQCFVVRHMIDDFILENGLGVAINPAKGQPDWVFTYGEMLSFKLLGEFYSSTPKIQLPEDEEITAETEALIAQPSESYLPQSARKVIRNHFAQHGIEDVKLFLMHRNTTQGVLQELVFNMTPDKFKSEEDYRRIMTAVAWFLPNSYYYVSMQESPDLILHFKPL